MTKALSVIRREAGRAVAAPTSIEIDQNIARILSERVAENNRLAFARNFAYAAVNACWNARGVRASLGYIEDEPIPVLSSEATVAAERFGVAVAPLDPVTIAHLIGTVYTTALPATFRAAHGIFYTPPAIVERLLDMAEDAGVDWTKARVLDPACGGGAFLVAITARILRSLEGTDPSFVIQQLTTRLRGFEIDPFGTWLGQSMVKLSLANNGQLAGQRFPSLIETRDSLDLRCEDYAGFDLVIGNPPYSRVTLAPDLRSRFARSVYGHANLYGLFTDAAINWARSGGVIAYVTPTSMLSGLYFKSLRNLLAHEAPPNALNFINEREGVFADVLQETMLATYRRNGIAKGPSVGFIKGSGEFMKKRKPEVFALPRRADAPWLLPRSPDQSMLARRLWSMPHRLADYGYEVSTGPLVWNRHKAQLQATAVAGALPVIWAESVTSQGKFVWRSEKRNHAPWFVPRKLKDDWLVVDRPCVLLQRTTAKEQPRRLIAAELPKSFIRKHKGVTVENHVNMIRAATPKPKVSPAVIVALLNSAAVDAAFRCINGSVAVSAFELEELPLPAPAMMLKLTELVASNANPRKIEHVISCAYRVVDAASAR